MDAPFGLVGRKLAHSYSPEIHRALAGIDYELVEVEPDELEPFLTRGAWRGLNVTIPYKKDAARIADVLTPAAERLGNVNTLVRLPDGRLLGDNTDYAGFELLVRSLGIEVAGKRALVFGGRGGAGSTVMAVLEDLGARPVAVSRTGAVTYADLPRFADAALVVNATPVGMYPACPAAPATLDALPALEGVIDIIYNPARTALMMEAERRGIAHVGGLVMLVGQAAAADRSFCGIEIDDDTSLAFAARLSRQEQNVALIGMPGAGKTRVGQELAKLAGRAHVDLDWELERRLQTTCTDFITTHGEAAFREQETAVLHEIGARSRQVISCGGGIVTRDENYPLLHQNSTIVMLDRPLDELSSAGRPISQRDGVARLAEERMPRYRAWADLVQVSRETPRATAEAVHAALA